MVALLGTYYRTIVSRLIHFFAFYRVYGRESTREQSYTLIIYLFITAEESKSIVRGGEFSWYSVQRTPVSIIPLKDYGPSLSVNLEETWSMSITFNAMPT